jgi:hypothetical protein
MWRLLAGFCVGIFAIALLNTVLLLFTPLGGIPLEGVSSILQVFFGVFAVVVWAAGVFVASVLAGLTPTILGSVAAAHLQLGSIIMSLPLLFISYVGGLIVFFGRRPDMV